MQSNSKRCPIEPSWLCDIADECNPAKISESSESEIFVGSLRCSHAKSRTEREVSKLARKVGSLPKCSVKGCGRPAVVAAVDGHDLCRFHVQCSRRLSKMDLKEL